MSQINFQALLDDGSHEACDRQLRALADKARGELRWAGEYGQQLLRVAADERIKAFPTPITGTFANLPKAQDSVPSDERGASDQRLIEAYAVFLAVQGLEDGSAVKAHRAHNQEVFGTPHVKSVDGAMNYFDFYASNVALRQALAPLVTQAAKAITTVAFAGSLTRNTAGTNGRLLVVMGMVGDGKSTLLHERNKLRELGFDTTQYVGINEGSLAGDRTAEGKPGLLEDQINTNEKLGLGTDVVLVWCDPAKALERRLDVTTGVSAIPGEECCQVPHTISANTFHGTETAFFANLERFADNPNVRFWAIDNEADGIENARLIIPEELKERFARARERFPDAKALGEEGKRQAIQRFVEDRRQHPGRVSVLPDGHVSGQTFSLMNRQRDAAALIHSLEEAASAQVGATPARPPMPQVPSAPQAGGDGRPRDPNDLPK